MQPDNHQIERLRWNVRQVRQYVLKALGEIEDQLDAIAGDQPVDDTDTNWEDNISKLVSEEMKK